MIIVLDKFQLKFGKARDAQALWKEAKDKNMMPGGGAQMRALVDVTGPAYTFVFESTYKDLAEWEQSMTTGMSDPRWHEWYTRFIPLCEGSHRDIYKIVD